MNVIDFVSGVLAGWAVVVTGQPLDFVKVKIQTALTPPHSQLAVIKEIYRDYGLKGFYRGSSSMLFGYSFIGGCEFVVYEWAKRLLYDRDQQRASHPFDTAKLSLWQVTVAGGISGTTIALIYCPVEYTKIHSQLALSSHNSSLRHLLQQLFDSGIRNIYKGLGMTTLREIYGSMVFFGSYETVVRAYTGEDRSKANSLIFLSAGAVAGLNYSLLTYPIDMIKSNIQAGLDFRESLSNSMMFSKAKGFKVVLVRALIANSASFWTYETMQKWLNYQFNKQEGHV